MRYKIEFWNLNEDEEFVIKCETKNQIIQELMELSTLGVVESISVFDTVKGVRI